MQAGKLNRTITVQREEESVGATGAVTKQWANLLTVRAEVRERTADEIATGFGEAETETLVFVVRWCPSPITTGDRILYQGRSYDLRQIVEVGRRRGWKLRAVAA